jgi:hypothetical protein
MSNKKKNAIVALVIIISLVVCGWLALDEILNIDLSGASGLSKITPWLT